ncbi:galactose mutarotase [Novosphingobium flavum]|uniref:aldose epimerase family protein n=1 Tax=Novosphingobium aerophilum TaxID=2839843 RepID=UPI00163B2B68|nr:aldose epimerase family protein [Novosphingobium aerophilum]MBC2663495.1 galactose mutarotase [Novosphingobium aerophilum]
MTSVKQHSFGYLPDGREASLFELTWDEGLRVAVSDFGASIVSVVCPDREGHLADVALGCGSAEEQSQQSGYLGAMIGRVAGRISNAAFDLNGERFALSANEGRHHLHGGEKGFSHCLWRATVLGHGRCGVEFHLVSADGDQGYPGDVECRLSYELIGPNCLALTCVAKSSLPTPFNPTSHAYFNLEGHDAGSIAEHWLQILAEQYTPTNSELIPVGLIEPVAGTEFDFSCGKLISADWKALARGYDSNFVLKNDTRKLREAAIVFAPRSGRKLTVETDRPCLHLYTGGWLNVPSGKDGARYGPFAGLSLEAQGFPDALNHVNFPAEVLVPDEPFRSQTIFQFEAENRL